jgi:uncharacterized protein YndB with AHSA1/START domain
MVKTILIGLAAIVAVLVLGFLGVVAMQPNEFSISRSAALAAPVSEVFDQVNDLHKWQAWSPWAKLDPNAKNTFEGAPAGEGAVFRWSGNDEVGEGEMTITESRPGELVRFKLHFIKPMEDTCDTVFTFKPEGEKTTVTWTMSGKNNFMGKAFCLLMNMDKMIGDKFEEGLASMKAIVEAPDAPAASEAQTSSEKSATEQETNEK